jgi:hypothetical protein
VREIAERACVSEREGGEGQWTALQIGSMCRSHVLPTQNRHCSGHVGGRYGVVILVSVWQVAPVLREQQTIIE